MAECVWGGVCFEENRERLQVMEKKIGQGGLGDVQKISQKLWLEEIAR